jgi:hypothetical protein
VYIDLVFISIPYDSRSSLPIAEILVGPEPGPTLNLGQKLLLEWHYIFVHLNFQALQSVLRRFPFVDKRFGAAVKCDHPKCELCKLVKAKRRANKAETTTKNPERYGALKADHISPGLRVSVDHFECRQRGRTCNSYGKATSKQYVGGAFLRIMLHHMCMWNINLDFQLWKQSEQSNPMKECVWTMGSLFNIIKWSGRKSHSKHQQHDNGYNFTCHHSLEGWY